MSGNEGFELLETHLTSRQISDREDTEKLLNTLNYLPLAIKQASAYMAKKQISTTKYLKYCQSSDREMVALLSRDFEDGHRYREAKNPIATTWLISFQQIAWHDPLAADYLKFMCSLSEKAIPRSLLPQGAWTLEAEDTIGTLKAYAFITEREELDVYDIHRLVRLAMLNWLEKQGELAKWTEKVMRRIEEAFPRPGYDNKKEWLSYLPHARHALDRQTTVDNLKVDLFKLALSFIILGQYREAETMHRRELEGREKLQGPSHPRTLMTINYLGNVLQDQGEYEKAEAMYQRALEGQEKVLGPDHPDTLKSANNLGSALSERGEYEKAEAMFRRALEGEEKILGPDHPSTFSSVNDLGTALLDQGEFEKAEAMFRRALEGEEKSLGPDHPDTHVNADNLIKILEKQERHEEAAEIRLRFENHRHPRVRFQTH
ncbi:hypothetical protein VTN31DRAFT_2870 [Thermomyces dupontii]|uniref:uncharacterized protein n=1 Tax=Talaromyces thermophilus TaxID=28565 RepID=UPI0037449CB0